MLMATSIPLLYVVFNRFSLHCIAYSKRTREWSTCRSVRLSVEPPDPDDQDFTARTLKNLPLRLVGKEDRYPARAWVQFSVIFFFQSHTPRGCFFPAFSVSVEASARCRDAGA